MSRLTRFEITFNRIEARKCGGSRWTLAWKDAHGDRTVVAERVIFDLPLWTLETHGAISGNGVAYWQDRFEQTIEVVREVQGNRGRRIF